MFHATDRQTGRLMRCFSSILGVLILALNATAAEPRELLQKFCAGCHGGEKPKADLALDAIKDFQPAATWNKIFARLKDGTMPPKGKPQPTAVEHATLMASIAEGLRAIQSGRARLRRLNRVEYNNTLRDLLGIDIHLTDTLPEDGTAHGFDNIDAALDLSATHLERYLAAADLALDTALPHGPKSPSVKVHIEPARISKEHQAKYNRPRYGTWDLVRDDSVVIRYDPPTTPRMVIEPVVPTAGRYRYRILAAAENDPQKRLALRVYAGTLRSGAGRTWMHGAFDLSDKPAVIEFAEWLEKGDTISLAASGVTRQWNLPAGFQGPGIAVYSIDVEGPLNESASLLGHVDFAKGTLADVEAILRRFLPRAYRRAAAESEVAPFIALAKSRLEKGASFESALRAALKAVLCSPEFLYLPVSQGKLADYELASRLSYFLWSTMPDNTLFGLAVTGELSKPDVLRGQVERMLNDPKARFFTENFTGQWLDLRKLKATDPDAKLYPEFDPLLEYSLPFETRLFFETILKDDRSVLEFVDSDWSMLNARLAEHYGIGGVVGSTFRKVSLPAGCHRGGVLTQAAILKVTANGTTTSPVVRGAWVLDRILGTPAPPPPKDVPAIEPDTRGVTTIRQQLARHRSDAACAVCHDRIDPPGFALESFDPIGGWRTRYRVMPSKAIRPIARPAVNSAGELSDGRTFATIDGLKMLLLKNPDRIATALAERVTAYATGHGVDAADRDAIARIVAASKAKNYGFRTFIHEIVQSELFRNK